MVQMTSTRERNVKQSAKGVLLLISALLVSGCVSGESPSPPPRYAYDELLELGVTITPRSSSTPIVVSDIVVSNNFDYLELNGLDVVFIPTEQYSNKEISHSFIIRSSQIRFSIENADGSYTAIAPSDSVEAVLEDGPYRTLIGLDVGDIFNPYYSIDNSPWDFTMSVHLFYMPVATTHIELWFQESIGEEFQLVRRVGLDNLSAYTTYVVPKVESAL